MNIIEAKNIPLADYLQALNIQPCKQQGSNLWYLSPFRSEMEPSFKVNLSRNEWYDFGIGKGGNIIALAMELHHVTSVSDALHIISQRADTLMAATPTVQQAQTSSSFSFRQQNSLPTTASSPAMTDIRIIPLTHPALFQYLDERKVDRDIARQACQEVHFRYGGKEGFCIGFKNDAGGYELRSKYFKDCTPPKSITTVHHGYEQCCIFEGFMDYLSYLTLMHKYHTEANEIIGTHGFVILNSTANLSKAIDTISRYDEKFCYLDNDDAGKRAYQVLRSTFGQTAHNMSARYGEYKDLNDYLCRIKMQHRQKQDIKPARKGFRL